MTAELVGPSRGEIKLTTTWRCCILSLDNEDGRLALRRETLQSVLYEDLSLMTFRRPTEVLLRCHRAIQSGPIKTCQ